MAGINKDKDKENRLREKEAEKKQSTIDKNKLMANSQSIHLYFKKVYEDFSRSLENVKYTFTAHNVFGNSWRVNVWEKVDYGYTLYYTWFMKYNKDAEDRVEYCDKDLNKLFRAGIKDGIKEGKE